jgi:hypothetical protein
MERRPFTNLFNSFLEANKLFKLYGWHILVETRKIKEHLPLEVGLFHIPGPPVI